MNTDFQRELKRLGPDAAGRRAISLAEAQRYCRRLARSHYENFPLVSWLLPRKWHQHFYNIYAYCRWADDLADEVADPQRSLELLAWWRRQLADCYARRASHPVFVALDKTIRDCELPREPFEDLISAFEQDQQVCEYRTFDELLAYCRRSANPVGRLVLSVCGESDGQKRGWSDSICTGLQLANFWQDVGRDLERGRIYLPREDRERFGYTLRELKDRVTNFAFLELMRWEVERARQYLLAGLPLVEELPGRLQVDVELFALGGLKILERIEALDYRVWESRPVVTKRDVAGIMLRCAGRAIRRRLRSPHERTASETATAEEPKAAR